MEGLDYIKIPIASMYGIFATGKYCIHGAFGIWDLPKESEGPSNKTKGNVAKVWSLGIATPEHCEKLMTSSRNETPQQTGADFHSSSGGHWSIPNHAHNCTARCEPNKNACAIDILRWGMVKEIIACNDNSPVAVFNGSDVWHGSTSLHSTL